MKIHPFCYALIFSLIVTVTVSSDIAVAADLYLTTPLQSGPYAADGNIIAELNSVVGSDKVVLFAAGGTISLKPGFHALPGSSFRAILGSYSNLDDSTDTDAEGLPDWWELTYFEDLSQGRVDDYDSDGVPNYYEYKLDTDPADANSRDGGIFYEYDALGRIKLIIRLPER